MIYLLLAVLCSTAIFIVFKLFPRFRIDVVQAITVNYVIASGFGYLLSKGSFTPAIIMAKPWFYYALLIGVTFISVFHLFAESTRKVGVAHTSVASKMSVVIPVLFGFFLFRDTVSIVKITGVVTALLAFYLTFRKRGKTTFYLPYLIFPLLLFFGNGFNDSMLKIIQHYFIQDDFVEFLTLVFLVALVTGVTVAVIRRNYARARLHWRNIPAGIILGLLNWYSTYFFIVGMKYFPVSFYIPVLNVAIVSLAALSGVLLFREKLSPVNWTGILLALISIVMIASS